MERINVPSRKNYLVRDGGVLLADVTSELGVFGVAISYDLLSLTLRLVQRQLMLRCAIR
jgi:hypothetical protein